MLENHIVIIRGVDCSGFVVLFVCKGKKNIWIVQGVGVRKGSGSIVSKPKTHTPPLCPFRLIIIYIYIIYILLLSDKLSPPLSLKGFETIEPKP